MANGTISLTEMGLGNADLTAIGKLSEKGMTSEQIADAVEQAHLSKSAIEKIAGLQSSASEIDGKVIPIDTIALLRAKTVTPETVWVSGYHTKNDGAFGSNIYRWNPTSTATDNGGTIIKLTSIETGRYELQYTGAVNVKWFGVYNNGTDNGNRIQEVIEWAKTLGAEKFSNNALTTTLYFQDGIYKSNPLTTYVQVGITGESKHGVIFEIDNPSGHMLVIDNVTLTQPNDTPNDYVNSNAHTLKGFTLKTYNKATSGILFTGNWSYSSDVSDIAISAPIIGTAEARRNTVGVTIESLMPDGTTEAALYYTKLVNIDVYAFTEGYNILDFANDTTLTNCTALGRTQVGIRCLNTHIVRVVSGSFEVVTYSNRTNTYAAILDGAINTSFYGTRLELHGSAGTDFGRIKTLATTKKCNGVNLIGIETTTQNNSSHVVVNESLILNADNVFYVDKGVYAQKILSGNRLYPLILGAGEIASQSAGGFIKFYGTNDTTGKKGQTYITGGNSTESKVEMWGAFGKSSFSLTPSGADLVGSYTSGSGAIVMIKAVLGGAGLIMKEKSIDFIIPEYASNALALAGGLTIGQAYWNTTIIANEKVMLRVR